MTKKPEHKYSPKPEKIPRKDPQNSPDSILSKKPSWRFGMMDMGGNWGWTKILSKDILIEIVEKLKHFETMTWSEIDKNKHSHNIAVDRISAKAKQRLKECKLDDLLDTLYSLRLSGKERLWGNRENEAFYIIWWDPDHTVYPVPKKHT